jgi:pyruvyltransferase
MSDDLRAYWWNEEPNFGDAMTPVLLHRLFGLEVAWAALADADLTAAGSVIQWIRQARRPDSPPIHVWGSGYIFPDEPPPAPGTAIYHAVRGPASARLSGLSAEVVYGDPGLLAAMVFKAGPAGRSRAGIVPHLWHRDHAIVRQVAADNNLRVIDVMADPVAVIETIASCDFIVSSSLHGLVIADSFGIPNLWVTLEPRLFGGRWKFDDYYGAFGLQMHPVPLSPGFDLDFHLIYTVADYARPGLEALKDRLLGAFPYT